MRASRVLGDAAISQIGRDPVIVTLPKSSILLPKFPGSVGWVGWITQNRARGWETLVLKGFREYGDAQKIKMRFSGRVENRESDGCWPNGHGTSAAIQLNRT